MCAHCKKRKITVATITAVGRPLRIARCLGKKPRDEYGSHRIRGIVERVYRVLYDLSLLYARSGGQFVSENDDGRVRGVDK